MVSGAGVVLLVVAVAAAILWKVLVERWRSNNQLAEGFEPDLRPVHRPGPERRMLCDLRFPYAERDRSCPSRTSGSRCRTDQHGPAPLQDSGLQSRLIADGSGAPVRAWQRWPRWLTHSLKSRRAPR